MKNWTEAYYGITHLNGMKRGFQVTVRDYGSFAECLVFTPGSGFNSAKTKHDSVADAKAYGEAQAAALNAIN